MKAFAHGFHSTSRHPAIQNCQSSFISPLPSISRGFGAQTGKGVSFRTRDPVALQLACSGKSMESRTSMHVVANIASDGLVSKPSVRRKKLAVFVSGRGSNFQSLYEACIAGSVYGDVVVLVTNKSVCGGAAYAREKDIPVLIFPKTKEEPNGLSAINLVDALRKYDVDFILLAGYLKLIPVELVQAYPKSILNIHPSLLPAFGGKGFFGMKVHRAVIATGARYSGPTIHFVDEHYDTGLILAQRAVPVLATDTAEDLAARVLQEEHGLYVETVAALCEERIVWREDGVPVIQSSENPNMYY